MSTQEYYEQLGLVHSGTCTICDDPAVIGDVND